MVILTMAKSKAASKKAKASWKNPKVRAKRIAGIAKASAKSWRDPKCRKRRMKAFKNRPNPWKSKEYRDKMELRTQKIKELWRDPDWRAARVRAQLEAQNRPETNAKRSATLNENYAKMTKAERRVKWAKDPVELSAIMTKVWRRPGYKEKMSEIRKEQCRTLEGKVACSKGGRAASKRSSARLKKLWKTEAWREKMAPASRKALIGHIPWNKGLTKDTDPRIAAVAEKFKGQIPAYNKYRQEYEGILMRSSYETAFATWCDLNDVDWKYEPKTFYVGAGVWPGTTYTPDFYLPGLGVYVELKGRFGAGQVEKYQEFQRRYPDIPWILIQGNDPVLFATSLAFLEA